MKSKRIVLFGLVMVAAFSLAGCGSKSNSPSTSQSSGQASAAGDQSTNANAGEKVTLNIIVNSDDYYDSMPGFYDEVKAIYEKNHANVTVKFDVLPNDQIKQKLMVEGSAGGGQHDASICFDASTLGVNGYLEDVGEAVKKWDGYEGLTQGKKDRMSFNGVIYGTTYNNDTLGIWINKDIFQKAGIDPASIKSMDQLIAAFKTIKDKAIPGSNGKPVYPVVIDAGLDWSATNFTYGAGGVLKDADRKKITLNTPEFQEGLGLLRDVFAKEYAPRPDKDYALTRSVFGDGNAAMFISGEWDTTALQKTLGDKLGFIEQPTWKTPALPLGGAEWIVPKGTAHKELAEDWILTMVSKPVQELLVSKYHRMPTTNDMNDLPAIKDDPVLNVEASMVTSKARVMDDQWFPDKPDVAALYVELLNKVVYSNDNVPDLLKEFEKKMQAALNG